MKTYFPEIGEILLIAAAFFVFGVVSAPAQNEEDPVKWQLVFDKKSEKLAVNDKFTAELTAAIEKGWHLYAIEKIEGGPIPTRITISENQPFEIGQIIASEPLETEDLAFGVVTKFYKEKANFTLPVKVLKDLSATEKLQIKVRYQVCNDEICLPPKTVSVETGL